MYSPSPLLTSISVDRPPIVSPVDVKMNVEKLQKMAGSVRTGGKGSVRRKKKAVHKTNTTDDKRLQMTFKRLGLNGIPQIEEVTIYKDDNKVLHFLNPKVQASPTANTWVVSGSPQIKNLADHVPSMDHVNHMINQLGAENWKKLADQLQKPTVGEGEGEGATPGMTTIQEDDDDVPQLVAGETFEAAAEEGQKS